MKFRLNESGVLVLVDDMKVKNKIEKIQINKEKLKKIEFKKVKNVINTKTVLITASMLMCPTIGFAATGAVVSQGLFWKIFLTYIFPVLMDIAKVFCAIKVAQAFYQERRGGREEGTGIGALVSYGKWYILFCLLPFFVELIDEIGHKMYMDIKNMPSSIGE